MNKFKYTFVLVVVLLVPGFVFAAGDTSYAQIQAALNSLDMVLANVEQGIYQNSFSFFTQSNENEGQVLGASTTTTPVVCPSPALVSDLKSGKRDALATTTPVRTDRVRGEVTALQDFLWQYHGLYGWRFDTLSDKSDFVTGVYGGRTANTVKDFQDWFHVDAKGTPEYGKVLQKTRTAIQAQCAVPTLITVLSPNGGEQLVLGSSTTVRWTSQNVPSTNMLSIGVRSLSTNFDYSLIPSDTMNDGSEVLSIPSTLAPGSYLLFIKTVVDGSVINDWSNNSFSLIGAATSTNGSLSVSEDIAASPGYRVVQGGTAGITLARLKFHATNEAINLTQLALKLTNSASSSPADFAGNQVRLYKADGVTQVGSITFSGNSLKASSTITNFQIPANGDAFMIIKADLSGIGTVQPGTQGHLIAVDHMGNGGTKGVGLSSGLTIYSTSASTNVASVRTFSSVPTFADATTNTALMSGADLYKFTVSVPAAAGTTGQNGVQLNRVTFSIATSTGTSFTSAQLYGPNGAVSAIAAKPLAGKLIISFDSASPDRVVPAGTTKTYSLRGTTACAAVSCSMTLRLLGDYTYPALSAGRFMSDVAHVGNGDPHVLIPANLIWSPQASSIVTVNDVDWTNGYGLPIAGSMATMTNNLTARTFIADGTPPPSSPRTPNSLRVTGVISTTTPYAVHLSWADPANNETGFTLERATGSSTVFTTVSDMIPPCLYSGCGNAPYVAYIDSTVALGNIYGYRVSAHNAYGSSTTTPVVYAKVGTTAPAATLNLRSGTLPPPPASDTTPPVVSIVIPVKNGQSTTTTKSTVLLAAAITDATDPISAITATWQNATNGTSGAVTPTLYGWISSPITLVPGATNIITYTAKDKAGNVGKATVYVTRTPVATALRWKAQNVATAIHGYPDVEVTRSGPVEDAAKLLSNAMGGLQFVFENLQ